MTVLTGGRTKPRPGGPTGSQSWLANLPKGQYRFDEAGRTCLITSSLFSMLDLYDVSLSLPPRAPAVSTGQTNVSGIPQLTSSALPIWTAGVPAAATGRCW
jgi:hypothetical protein